MQFFHNPLQPTGQGVDKDKAKALTIWNKLESALRQQSNPDQILFQAELKRLCLVVEAALEIWDATAPPPPMPGTDPLSAGATPDQRDTRATFLRQLSIQLRILAHMRKLSTEQVEKAAQDANLKAQQCQDPNRSSAESLLESLQLAVSLTEDELLEGIGVQPLALTLVENQALFEDLGDHFFRIREHISKRRGEAERTLGQLLTLHSSKESKDQ